MYAKTKVFRIWHPTVVWGTLQTTDYAARVFEQVVNYYEIPDDGLPHHDRSGEGELS